MKCVVIFSDACPHCQRLKNELSKHGIACHFINLREKRPDEVMKEYPLYIDCTPQGCGVPVPQVLVFDGDGRLIFRKIGASPDVVEMIKKLLRR